jgi:adenylate cyclase
VLAIILATGILALSLTRSRHILAQSATQTQAASDLSLFFDSDVAEKITGADMEISAGQGMLRKAAILFTDMRGFTVATANLSPTEVVTMLREYQHLIVPIIRNHGGSIDKFMGDGILASFGAVKPSVTYAADVFKAVDDILKAAAAWRRKREGALAIGAGLAVGEVVFGTIGDGKRLEYTVIGDAVNLAAKLERHNKTEHTRALASRDALSIANAQGYETTEWEIRLQRIVDGVTEPIDLVVRP